MKHTEGQVETAMFGRTRAGSQRMHQQQQLSGQADGDEGLNTHDDIVHVDSDSDGIEICSDDATTDDEQV